MCLCVLKSEVRDRGRSFCFCPLVPIKDKGTETKGPSPSQRESNADKGNFV